MTNSKVPPAPSASLSARAVHCDHHFLNNVRRPTFGVREKALLFIGGGNPS
jgi:hypothetical protein